MKIISGILKGRRIEVGKKLKYRPTLSRIREDIFNILAHNPNIKIKVNNSSFADICCGSGSIGIEALSRGFKHCHFNDVDNEQIKKISLFLKKYSNLSYSLTDVDLVTEINEIPWINFDIIYFDPPYEIKLESIILQHIKKFKDHSIVITESDHEIFKGVKSIYGKKYKNKFIQFYNVNELKKF